MHTPHRLGRSGALGHEQGEYADQGHEAGADDKRSPVPGSSTPGSDVTVRRSVFVFDVGGHSVAKYPTDRTD